MNQDSRGTNYGHEEGKIQISVESNIAGTLPGLITSVPSVHLEINVHIETKGIVVNKTYEGQISIDARGLRNKIEVDKPNSKPSLTETKIELPRGKELEIANKLAGGAKNFKNDALPYSFPDRNGTMPLGGTNSNSFASGLLQFGTGNFQYGVIEDLKNNGYVAPGYGNPMSEGLFKP